MKDFFKLKSIKEEHGAGDIGTPSLVAKYKTGTPGQTSAPPTRQPARKGDKLNAKMDYSSTITRKDIGVKNTMSESKESVRAELKKIADRMDQIEKSGGRIPLTDPLHQKAKTLRAKLKTMKENNEMEKSEMAETQLHFISYAAEEILEYMDMGGEIEEWYQNKLSKAHSDMEGLHSYVEGEKRRTGMVEESTEVNELSKKTLGNYVKAAGFDSATKAMAYGSETGGESGKKKNFKTLIKREKGVSKAVDRLTKEDTEHLDELKTSTLTRYGTKAVQSLGQNPEKTYKRVKGIQTARYKVQQKYMKKEEVTEGDNKQMKGKDPCWKGYQMVGTKKKGGKSVPNCVPTNEAMDKEHPIVKEYDSLKKNHDIKSLRNLIKGQKKIVDASEYRSKDHAATAYLRSKHGDSKVAAAFGLKEASYKVDVEGLPTMYIDSKSPAEVKSGLRKLLRKPDSINSVERVMDADVRKAFRLKAQGKDTNDQNVEEGLMKDVKRFVKGTGAKSRAGSEINKAINARHGGDSTTANKHYNRFKKLNALTTKENYKSDAQRKAVWASRNEVLDPSQGAGEYVKDFEKSDAPQFKGKTKKERQKMAVAAYLSAKRGD